MARYDYKCTKCEHVFEVKHAMSEHPEVKCPKCGADASRVISTSGIKFSGSGFYNTDQRTNASSSASGLGSIATR